MKQPRGNRLVTQRKRLAKDILKLHRTLQIGNAINEYGEVEDVETIGIADSASAAQKKILERDKSMRARRRQLPSVRMPPADPVAVPRVQRRRIARSVLLLRLQKVEKRLNNMDKNSVSDKLATFTKKAFGVSSSGCDSDTEHFREVTKKMLDLFAAKNADYGNSFRKLYAEIGFRIVTSTCRRSCVVLTLCLTVSTRLVARVCWIVSTTLPTMLF